MKNNSTRTTNNHRPPPFPAGPTHSTNTNPRQGTLLLLTTLILAALILSLSSLATFTTGPQITPTGASTNDSLLCEWTATGTTITANVTWYRNGALNATENNISCTSGQPCQTPTGIDASAVMRDDEWNCTVTLYNGSTTQTQSTKTTIANADPTIIPVSDPQTLTEDTPYYYDFNATDAENDPLFWTSREINTTTNSTISPPLFRFSDPGSDEILGIISFTPDANDVGNHTMEITVTDGHEGADSIILTYIVNEVNDNPLFTVTDQNATEDIPFSYLITPTDEENDLPFNFSLTTTPASRIILIQINSTTANITFNTTNGAPDFQDGGTYNVTVTANDTRGGSTTKTFLLTVITTNQQPNLTLIQNQTWTEGQLLTFNLSANDADVNDTLTFSVNDTRFTANTINNSNNATGNVTAQLDDAHVGYYPIKITVTDIGGATDSQTVWINITNVNDAPLIHNTSQDSQNTDGSDIHNLTAYAGAPFAYHVNATDNDTLTPTGEVLTYTLNDTSKLSINATTGLVTFTPTQTDVGVHTVLVTVTDDEGLSDNETLTVTTLNNSAPAFDPITNVTCYEDLLCTAFITATDQEGDNITIMSNNTAVFNLTTYNTTTAVHNTTHNQSDVGNYTILLTATDTKGASNTTTINLSIIEQNDLPVLDTITFPTIVEEHPVLIYLHADDEDYLLNIENITFNRTFLTGKDVFNITTRFNTSNNKTYGVINFTPATNDDGFYSVNITATDKRGGTDWQVINFTIYNKTLPPNITQIKPYGNASANNAIIDAFTATTNYPNNNTPVTLNENTTYTFNHTTTDDTTAPENLTFAWYYDGSLSTTTHAYTKSFDFFSSGTHTILLVVNDDRLENATWQWTLTVQNVNRAPSLSNPLDNLTANGTTTYSSYFNFYNSQQKFYDPDDDTNSDGQVTGNETTSLTFNATTCNVATLSISGASLTVTPTSVGNCTVTFSASDGQESVTSNTVTITTTGVSESQTSTSTSSSGGGGGGGGGGSSTSTQLVPIPQDNPIPLNIVAPENIVITDANLVRIPVKLQNTWDRDLQDITVQAKTNATGIELSYSQTFFETIPPNSSASLTITASNYRLGEAYEVVIEANVTSPKFFDSASVFVSALEAAQDNLSVDQKVTFARDLLNDNPECQELNEQLEQARERIEEGNLKEAEAIIDATINGCRYLVSQVRKVEEQPTLITTALKKKPFQIGLIAIFTILLLATIGTVAMTLRNKYHLKEKEDSTNQET
ncbi:hypothetical protein D6783_01680 [Candidatus Woesearchaeota archaeon]|nr:MAG: hypothetical protein D6783_01680 [Candidatus Woesearchaeota archaeon]